MVRGSNGKKVHGKSVAHPEHARFKRYALAGLSLALACSVWGCAGNQGPSGEQRSQPQGSSQASTATDELDLDFSKRDLDPSYDETSATKVIFSVMGTTVEGDGASAEGADVTIQGEGTYLVSGVCEDGSLRVAAGDEDKLQIVFDGLTLTNPQGPAVYIENADKCFITLAEGSANALSDGTDYALDGEDDNRDGVIFSRDDLTINGTGSLTVTGNYQHGVVSKDDLVIAGGTITAVAKEDAFQGKDAIKIASGSITADAGDDAFHSEYLFYAQDGAIEVESCTEGYEAEKIIIEGGEHTINASDDALNAAVADSDDRSVTVSADGGTSQGNGGGGAPESEEIDGLTPPSDPMLDGAPDGVSSGDVPNDISARESDRTQQGHGGRMKGQRNGSESFTPQERPDPSADGSTSTSKSDRAFGNADATEMQNGNGPRGNFGGGQMAESSSDCLIRINGGTLTLSGGNDGLDSNGNVEINGGLILVCGPSSGMDGFLDYDLNATVNGGTALMVGSLGSTMGLDQSGQPWTIANVHGNAGQTVVLESSSGEVLASMTSTLGFPSVFASSPEIAEGSSFSIMVDGAPTEITMTPSQRFLSREALT